MTLPLQPGQIVTGLEIGPPAHGGHFVARHEGMVLFVRHAISGELVDVRITEVAKRYARADTITVHRPSPHRVRPPCPIAGRCGGCDFQHLSPAHAREVKRTVVAEQLDHLAGYRFTGEVAEVAPAPLGWRRRMRYQLDAEGRAGLRVHRSAELVQLPDGGCRIADPAIAEPPSRPERAGQELVAVASASGVLYAEPDSNELVVEQVGEQSYQVGAAGFWQAHAGAAQLLTEAVMAGLAPRAGESALDLYCGVGLFAGVLAAAGVEVWGVEGDQRAAELAGRNVPSGHFLAGDVQRLLRRLPARADLVVLDPPRAGAGATVLAGVAARRPRAIAYVACDPAALARDLRTAAELGYQPVSVAAYDLFPMTHHVECIALLTKTCSDLR